jgi:hypothetical protein
MGTKLFDRNSTAEILIAMGISARCASSQSAPLSTRFAQYPPTDGHDITALFRNRYEILGKHDSALRLTPSNECLGAGERLRREIHLRLVVQNEFAAVQSMAQAALYGSAAPGHARSWRA